MTVVVTLLWTFRLPRPTARAELLRVSIIRPPSVLVICGCTDTENDVLANILYSIPSARFNHLLVLLIFVLVLHIFVSRCLQVGFFGILASWYFSLDLLVYRTIVSFAYLAIALLRMIYAVCSVRLASCIYIFVYRVMYNRCEHLKCTFNIHANS